MKIKLFREPKIKEKDVWIYNKSDSRTNCSSDDWQEWKRYKWKLVEKYFCFNYLSLVELCPWTAFYYFWECHISQTTALMPMATDFLGTFPINRIGNTKGNGPTEKVCCPYITIRRQETKKCLKNVMLHCVFCHVSKYFTHRNNNEKNVCKNHSLRKF